MNGCLHESPGRDRPGEFLGETELLPVVCEEPFLKKQETWCSGEGLTASPVFLRDQSSLGCFFYAQDRYGRKKY
jgi:hypothetical protein